MNGNTVLVLLILIGIICKSNIIATASCILLTINLVRLNKFFPMIERRGLEIGLLFLLLAVLVPFADGQIQLAHITNTITTMSGVLAIIGGVMATNMNGKGLEMLRREPQLVIGIVIGAIIGIVFFGGVPIGPLMAAGIMAIFADLFRLNKKKR